MTKNIENRENIGHDALFVTFPAVFVHRTMDKHRIAGETWGQVNQPCLEATKP